MNKKADKRQMKERDKLPYAAAYIDNTVHYAYTLSYELYDECVRRFGPDGLINSVKLIRERTGCGIFGAKEMYTFAKRRLS